MLRDERARSARTNPTGAVASIENTRTNPATVRPNEPDKRSPKRTQEADRLRFPKAYRLPASANDDEGGPNEPEPPPDGEGLLAGYRYFLGHGRDEAARYWLLRAPEEREAMRAAAEEERRAGAEGRDPESLYAAAEDALAP